MGLAVWFARKGNVGGTARAVAKGWMVMKERNPEKSARDIAEAYIEFRYGVTPLCRIGKSRRNILVKSEGDKDRLQMFGTYYGRHISNENHNVYGHGEYAIGYYYLQYSGFLLQNRRKGFSTIIWKFYL